MSPQPQFAAAPISQELHEHNLEMLADIARRELLEAIKYERNYSPLTWFKSVEIAPRDASGLTRKAIDGKRERLKLLGRHSKFNAQRRALQVEVLELEKELVEGKQ